MRIEAPEPSFPHYTDQHVSDFRLFMAEYYGLQSVSVVIDQNGMHAETSVKPLASSESGKSGSGESAGGTE